MYQAYLVADTDVAIALLSVVDASRYGRVVLADDERNIITFHEKGMGGPGLINAGVYLFRQTLLERFALPEAFSLEKDCFEARLDEIRFTPYTTNGYFIDIGIPLDYQRAQSELKRY